MWRHSPEVGRCSLLSLRRDAIDERSGLVPDGAEAPVPLARHDVSGRLDALRPMEETSPQDLGLPARRPVLPALPQDPGGRWWRTVWVSEEPRARCGQILVQQRGRNDRDYAAPAPMETAQASQGGQPTMRPGVLDAGWRRHQAPRRTSRTRFDNVTAMALLAARRRDTRPQTRFPGTT